MCLCGSCLFLAWGVFCLFVVCLCFPHVSEINTVVCEVVCEVERPSELSWRARHGRKKTGTDFILRPSTSVTLRLRLIGG